MLRALVGFDHCPKNVNNSWIANCGLPVGPSGYWGGSRKPLFVNDAGYITCAPGATSGGALWPMDLSPFVVTSSGARKYVIGMRVIKTKMAQIDDAIGYLGTSGGQTLTLPNYASVGLSAKPEGSSVFVEFVLDTTVAICSMYVDGVYITQFSMTTYNATLNAGTLYIWWNCSTPNWEGVYGFKDFYFLDDAQGDGLLERLGPRVLYPVTVDAASGSDWTATDSSPLLTVLNTPFSAASPALINSGPSKAPLNLSLSCNIPASAKAESLMLYGSVKADSAALSVGNSITKDGVTTPVKTFKPGTTLKYGNLLGVYPRAPGSIRWTTEIVDGSTVLVAPDL